MNNLSRWGFGLTVLYLIVLAWVTFNRLDQLFTMPLNELGDFLAGAFGPLAIFWLILGFLQQGKELQQSTEALNLQAEELNNSVQQQKELVEVQREQMESDRQQFLSKAKPNFIISTGTTLGAEDTGVFQFRAGVSNVGATITKVVLTGCEGMTLEARNLKCWEKGENQIVIINLNKPIEGKEWEFKIDYTDMLGNDGCKSFEVLVGYSGFVEISEIKGI